MICCFCRAPVDDIDGAVEAGWSPDFWHAGVNYEGPVCPVCCKCHLTFDSNGDADLRIDSPLPDLAIPLVKVPPNRA
jgi:hypothetical protein